MHLCLFLLVATITTLPIMASSGNSGQASAELMPSAGISLEPLVGYLFNDAREKDKLVGGLRLSAIVHDESDATISGEIGAFSATRFSGDQSPDSDYFFQFGPAVYEFYQPWAFRVGAGMAVEMINGTASSGFYYRGGLGRYLTSGLGLFLDLSGFMIFRSDGRSLPLSAAMTAQVLF